MKRVWMLLRMGSFGLIGLCFALIEIAMLLAGTASKE